MIKRDSNKKAASKKGSPEYMATYGDMMTLLMCFFVLLFSMAEIDAEKFRIVMSSFTGAVSVLDGSGQVIDVNDLLENEQSKNPYGEQEDFLAQSELAIAEAKGVLKSFQEYIKEKKLEEEVSVDRKGSEIIITFDAVLLFESGRAEIKEEALVVLDVLGVKLKEYVENGYELKLEGHTDNVPIATLRYPSNWELSASRAIAVARYYINEKHFDAQKLSATGYGEQIAVDTNDTVEGRAKNRRVELKLARRLKDY